MPESAKSELQRTVDEITGYTERTRGMVHRQQLLVRIVAAVAVVALALGVVVILLFIGSQDQSATIRQEQTALRQEQTALHESQLKNCGLSNTTKAKEQALWNELVTLSVASSGRLTSGQKSVVQAFERDVTTTFAPLDCEKLYSPT